jgi:hypothetical protein
MSQSSSNFRHPIPHNDRGCDYENPCYFCILHLLRMHVIVTAPTWKRLVLDKHLNMTQCCKLRSGASRLTLLMTTPTANNQICAYNVQSLSLMNLYHTLNGFSRSYIFRPWPMNGPLILLGPYISFGAWKHYSEF